MSYSINPEFFRFKLPGGISAGEENLPELPPPDMSRPPVSFIIPVHSKSSRYLPAALDSVLAVAQNYGPAEILLADDLSPDDSYAVMERYRELYPGMIRTFRNESNLGIARTRQRLVDASDGEYIISFDQDDIMLNFNLAAAVEVLEKNRNYAASYAPKRLFNSSGILRDIHGGDFSYFTAFFAPKVNVNAMILRRSDLLAHGSFEVFNNDPFSPIDDVYLFARLARDRDLHFDPAVRCMWRRHDTQFSNTGGGDEKFQVMAYLTAKAYPEIYDAVMRLDIPECTPENFRLVRGLVGVAVYLNQKNFDFACKLFDYALEHWPEDYSIWENYLRLLGGNGKYDEVKKTAALARERFKDNLYPLLTISGVEIMCIQISGGHIPAELVREYTALENRYYEVSPVLREAVRRYCNNFAR